MAAGDLKGFMQVGFDILSTTVETTTKKILAQIGNVVGQTVDSDNVEWWQHYGFASRPPKPEPGKSAAQAVVLRGGDHDIAIASQDLRGLELYGQLDHGEVCIYAAGEDGNAQARVLLKKNGSINLFTKKGNTADGAGMGIFVDPDGSISLAGGSGAGFQLSADNSVKLFNAAGSFQIKADGKMRVASKTKLDISAPAIALGGGAASAPVVVATDLTAFAGLVAAAITASGAPTAAAAVAAFTPAATALVTGLAATRRTTAE